MINKERNFNDAVMAIAQYLYDHEYSVRIKFFKHSSASGVELVVNGENEFPEDEMNDMSYILTDDIKHEYEWGSGIREIIIYR